jgi:ATP-binding cassette subfamily B protein
VNLKIPKGYKVGFIGTTGSGKTTLLDLIMGLLSPTSGKILVDGKELNGPYLLSWQKIVAHVPQNIFLTDSSFIENIAFGIPGSSVDLGRVKEAAHQANISDFIEAQEDGYNSRVGERGIRLSGGQRQRIAIARAFYKQANVLVLDEATSALDTETEINVMSAIDAIDRTYTVLIIAHRISTLHGCDMIIELKNGKVVKIYSGKEVGEFIKKS